MHKKELYMKRFMNVLVGCALSAVVMATTVTRVSADEEKKTLDSPEVAQAMTDAKQAEDAQDWESALQQYETLYESGVLDQAGNIELRKKFAQLRPQVKKNRTLANANVWRVKAYIFKTLDFTWDDNGEKRRSVARYSQEEIDRIIRCLKGFEYIVWDFSDGWLRIEWDCTVVYGALTEMAPIGDRFWIAPDTTMKFLPELGENEADTIMVFANTFDHNATENNDYIPTYSFGAAVGAWYPETKGATYISFCWEEHSVDYEPDGEAMTHEWLHSLQWALDNARHWPLGLTGDPDGGRSIGEEHNLDSADPCFRRDPEKENTWIEFYRHILQTHTTRNMLRDASPREK